MRASPTKAKTFTDHKKKEEFRICQKFRGNLKAGKVSTRLNFDNNAMGANLNLDNSNNKQQPLSLVSYNSMSYGSEKVNGGGTSSEMKEDVESARILKRGREETHLKGKKGHDSEASLIKMNIDDSTTIHINQQQLQPIFDAHMHEDQYMTDGASHNVLDSILQSKSKADGAGIHNSLGNQ